MQRHRCAPRGGRCGGFGRRAGPSRRCAPLPRLQALLPAPPAAALTALTLKSLSNQNRKTRPTASAHRLARAAPPPVRDHVSAATGSRMLVVGGCTAAGYVDGSRVHVLETESLVWAQLRCGGQVPSARAGHAAAMTPSHGAHGGSDLCIFGGGDGRRGFADLFRLDLASAAWSKVRLAPLSAAPGAPAPACPGGWEVGETPALAPPAAARLPCSHPRA